MDVALKEKKITCQLSNLFFFSIQLNHTHCFYTKKQLLEKKKKSISIRNGNRNPCTHVCEYTSHLTKILFQLGIEIGIVVSVHITNYQEDFLFVRCSTIGKFLFVEGEKLHFTSHCNYHSGTLHFIEAVFQCTGSRVEVAAFQLGVVLVVSSYHLMGSSQSVVYFF